MMIVVAKVNSFLLSISHSSSYNLLPNQPQAEISRRGFEGVKENLEPIYYKRQSTADVDDKKAIRRH